MLLLVQQEPSQTTSHISCSRLIKLGLQKTAQQAGMPDEFIQLAETTLARLEEEEVARRGLERKNLEMTVNDDIA
jgi:antitoxin component of RelBE/YafQ-DinJ toxin-antitoxin module